MEVIEPRQRLLTNAEVAQLVKVRDEYARLFTHPFFCTGGTIESNFGQKG